MHRPPNPIDFWRGLALVFIFINHIPGIFYSHFTHAQYSISDSADLFVFLAGWALRYVGEGVGSAVKRGNDTLRQALNWALFRLWERGKFSDLWLRYFPISPF